MDILERSAGQRDSLGLINALARNVSDGCFLSVADMVKETGQSVSGFIDALLKPSHQAEPDVNPVEAAERRRRRLQAQQDQGLGR